MLIGYLEERSDLTPTPLELKFPGVAVHTTLIENIVKKKFVRDAGWGGDLLLLCIFTGFMMISQAYPYRFSSRRPKGSDRRRIAIAFGIVLGFVLLNFGLFCITGWFYHLSLPLLTMALAWTACHIEKLREQKVYNALILEYMDSGLIVFDSLTGEVELNPKAVELLGCKTSRTILNEIESQHPDLARYLTEIEASDRMLPLKVGEHDFQVSLVPKQDDFSRAIAVLTDVTEVKALSAKLQRQQDEQEHQQALENLVKELNHDIKNKVHNIIGSAGRLERFVHRFKEAGEPPSAHQLQRAENQAGGIIEESRTIRDIVIDILDKIRTRCIEDFEPASGETHNLADIVDAALQRHQSAIEDAGVHLAWHRPSASLNFACDKDALCTAVESHNAQIRINR